MLEKPNYFEWLCEIINLDESLYDVLIFELYAIDFEWLIPLDSDRYYDGIVLREGFYNSRGIYNPMIDKPCSVLEVLICLAQRFNFLLDDDDRGDRTRLWFWEMIEIEADTGTVTEINYVETVDGDGNPVTEAVETELTVLYITVSKTPMEVLYLEYAFDEERCAKRDELLSDEYVTLWNNVLYGTGSGCGDLVAVALSQVGNTGETYWTYMGYTSRVEWCACFVSWCANECGYIEDGTLPKTAGCSVGVQWFKDRNRWQEPTYTDAQGQTVPYIPAPGDIIYFDWNRAGEGQNGRPDHVGIVEKIENGYIFTIEGNSGDCVASISYSLNEYQIFGYGITVFEP